MTPGIGLAASLPRELVDMILGYVDEDTATLKSCRLVSASWNTLAMASTFFLFRDLDVYTPRRGRNVEALLKILAAAPHVATCIRRLKLRGPPQSATPRRTIDAGLMSRLLQSLPNLDTLTLDCLEYGRTGGWPAAASNFQLKKLTLNCYMINRNAYQTFLKILSLFSELEELCIQSCVSECTSPAPSITLPFPPPTIRSLALEHAQYHMLPLLRNVLQIPPSVIQSFSVVCKSRESVDGLGKMIAEYGPHLTTLAIEINELRPDVSETRWRELFADNLVMLTSLVLVVSQPSQSWTSAFNILAVIPENITQVTVVCSLTWWYRMAFDWEAYAIRSWTQLGRTLARFTQLQSVSLFWRGDIRSGHQDDRSIPDLRVWRVWTSEERTRILDAFGSSPVKHMVRFEKSLVVETRD